MPKNSKNQGNSINQGGYDEIKRQSNKHKNQREYGEGQMSRQRAKTISVKGNEKSYLLPSGFTNLCYR
jgi:hypothetical protein